MVRATLSDPILRRVFLASVIGRLPIGAIALILILRTREMTGSYAAGGVVAGANALFHGLAAPLVGRLIDRRGQPRILLACGAVSTAALGGFALLGDGAPLGIAIALAAVAGAAHPPLGPTLRAIWTARIEDPDRRHAAFSFESIVFELIYISGPLLLVTAIGSWSLRAAAVAAAALTAAGTLAFATAQAAREWRPAAGGGRDLWGAMRGPGVRVLVGVLFLFGLTVAAIEMAIVAFADARGAPGAVGPILALWGAGSMAGGIFFARRGAPADVPRQIALLYGALAAACALPLLAQSMVALGALIVLSGFFIAPALALSFGRIGDVAPAGKVTEAYTWSATGITCGVAAGSALAGWLVETTGGTAEAFVLGVAAATAAAVLVAARPERLQVATA